MSAKFTDLHCKEVICISDGRRLGLIQDVIIQLPKGEVSAIVVPGRCKLGGLGPPRDRPPEDCHQRCSDHFQSVRLDEHGWHHFFQ